MDEDVFVNEFSEAAQILYDLFEDKILGKIILNILFLRNLSGSGQMKE